MVRLNRNSISWPLAFLLLIAASDITMMLTAQSHPSLVSMGVALDFMIVLPLLVFWMGMRRKSIKRPATIALALTTALAGYLTAQWFVPVHDAELRLALDMAALCAGIGLSAYVFYFLTRFRASYRLLRKDGVSPVDAIANAFAGTASSEKLGRLFAHEASIGYHALLSWRKKPYTKEHATAFSTTEQSNMLVIVIAAAHLLVLEGIGVHFLIHQWSAVAAWILSLSNAYIIFVLIADFRLTKLNPVLVSEHLVRIRFAHDIWTDLRREQISGIRLLTEPLPARELRTTAAPLFCTPNIVLEMATPVPVTSRFGNKRNVKHVALCIDQPQEFIAALKVDADVSLHD